MRQKGFSNGNILFNPHSCQGIRMHIIIDVACIIAFEVLKIFPDFIFRFLTKNPRHHLTGVLICFTNETQCLRQDYSCIIIMLLIRKKFMLFI